MCVLHTYIVYSVNIIYLQRHTNSQNNLCSCQSKIYTIDNKREHGYSYVNGANFLS